MEVSDEAKSCLTMSVELYGDIKHLDPKQRVAIAMALLGISIVTLTKGNEREFRNLAWEMAKTVFELPYDLPPGVRHD